MITIPYKTVSQNNPNNFLVSITIFFVVVFISVEDYIPAVDPLYLLTVLKNKRDSFVLYMSETSSIFPFKSDCLFFSLFSFPKQPEESGHKYSILIQHAK